MKYHEIPWNTMKYYEIKNLKIKDRFSYKEKEVLQFFYRQLNEEIVIIWLLL